MRVIDIVENEDGSAKVDIEFEDDEVQLLLQDAVRRAIEKYIELDLKGKGNE